MENLKIYNQVRNVPTDAQSKIEGGRLSGFTNINPMWRIQALTEQFGPVGIGWYYLITNKWLEEGANGEKIAFLDIELYVKIDGEWSKPIVGTGANVFIANQKNGLYTSDEAYKMALTDALSVSCKALGIGADIYYKEYRTKYNQYPNDQTQQQSSSQNQNYQNKQSNNQKQEIITIRNNIVNILAEKNIPNYELQKYIRTQYRANKLTDLNLGQVKTIENIVKQWNIRK